MERKISNRAKIQAFGGFLTNMVLPNIGAFIAWGIVTAFFIPTGWTPNKHLNELVGPTVTYLLPLLLAYTGGKMVGGNRGAVLGSIATIGAIIGSDIPMFLGAMILGPLGGYIMKKADKILENKIPAGFEMIVNNFSIGILGFFLMILSFLVIGPVVGQLNGLVEASVQVLVKHKLLPLVALINEPAKVLFLNNVIDQGIYYPLGTQQTLKLGKSIYFMLASNPGPGLGLLLAYTVFGKKAAKRTAPGAIIIHFLGGIHEMYFPYVLMKPLTIIGMIGGAMSGIVTAQIFKVGLVGGPSPGSIIAYLALTPRGNFIGVIAAVTIATLVSFLITSVILKADKTEDEDHFDEMVSKSKEMKAEGKNITNQSQPANITKYTKISYACDAGMGSSAMGATIFRKKLKEAGIEDVEVKHYRIEDIPEDSDLAVIHEDLAERAKMAHPNLTIVPISNYLQDLAIDNLVNEVLKVNKN